MKKAVPVSEAAATVPHGAVVMVGGFMGVGSPHRLIGKLMAPGVAVQQVLDATDAELTVAAGLRAR
jgi:acetate CoA/acetoacetate CoA-transferase alpha subunit